MLKIGTKAPEFRLPDQNGQIHTLEEFRGKKVVLYFYPRDNSSDCTAQACRFGELYPHFREQGAVVVGISRDSVESHKDFQEKFSLPFLLLSDTGLTAIKDYDVLQEEAMRALRTTYLIDENGMIIKAYGDVNAAENPDAMLGQL